MKKKLLLIALLLGILLSILLFSMILFARENKKEAAKFSNENQGEKKEEENKEEKWMIEIDGKTSEIVWEENETAMKLQEMIPLTLSMQELNGNEKYYYFEETFPTKVENISTIEKGDILLYQNNCLVIFYDSFETAYSYTFTKEG